LHANATIISGRFGLIVFFTPAVAWLKFSARFCRAMIFTLWAVLSPFRISSVCPTITAVTWGW